MDLKSPRRKKSYKTHLSSSLPVVPVSEGEIYKFTGQFDGFSVIIRNQEDGERLNIMGFFGKSNLAKSSSPSSSDPCIIRKRQFTRRKLWAETTKNVDKRSLTKVIVIPDSESDDENYFSNLKADYEIDCSVLKKTLNLSLVEAYFLSHDVKCLKICYEDRLMEDEILWTTFSKADNFFPARYVTYHHFRKKNWITKTGIKFGGDFLLYKDGPSFYHASYVVIIDVLDENLQRREDKQIRSMKFANIIGLNRLCETAGKELLICQLIWPRNIAMSSVNDISNTSINEVIMRRWIANKEIKLTQNLEDQN